MKKIFYLVYQKGIKLFYGTGIGRHNLVNKINRYFISQLKPDFIEIGGSKIFLDEKDSLGLSIAKVHEKIETNVVKQEVKAGEVVIDVGAHIGYYTLIFANRVGKNGHVYAFEADLNNFRLLTKNVEANNLKNVTCINKVVSNKIGKVKLFSSNSSTGNRLFGDINESNIEIDSITLDEYFKNYSGKINFIKLDIQGAEPLAIEGMKSIISNNYKLTIMQEWWPNGIKKIGLSPRSHLDELVEKGFKIIEVDDINEKLVPSTVDSLMNKYPNESHEDINLICKRTNETR